MDKSSKSSYNKNVHMVIKKIPFPILSPILPVLMAVGIFLGFVLKITEAQAAAPAFRCAGAIASNAAAVAVAPNAAHQGGDVELLFVETANQAATLSPAAGFVEVTNIGVGTGAGADGTRITVFWRRWNGTDGSPTVADSGDHQMARIISYSGVITSGNPWDIFGTNAQTPATTSGSVSTVTTATADTLVVIATAGSLPDATGTAEFSAWTNANLGSLTERTDNTVIAGNGGSLGVADGTKATAGATGATTFTSATSATKASAHIALKPQLPPDFSITTSDIAFNNSSPLEDASVRINATIHNNGASYSAFLNTTNYAAQGSGAKNATSGSYQGVNPPDLANDGLTTTGWASNSGADWLKVDMNTTRYIRNLAWDQTLWAAANVPYNFTMSLSSDDSNWTEVVNVTGNILTTYNTTLTNTVSAQYIKMYSSIHYAGNATTLDELQGFKMPSVAVDFYDGNPASGGLKIGTTQFNDSIAGGGTAVAAVTWTAAGGGNHDIYAVIDNLGEITETNETNNTAYKTITVAGPNFTQTAYRWFNNLNSTDVGTSLANQNTPFNLTAKGQLFRLRTLLHVSDMNVTQSGKQFNLQFAPLGLAANCADVPGVNYSNIEAIGKDWVQNTNAPWTARDYPIGASFNGKIWVFSGWGAGAYHDSWFTTDGNTWTQANATCGWSAREKAVTTVYNNSMWILGGHQGSNVNLNDTWYTTDGGNWTQATAAAGWTSRCMFVALTYNNSMWVLGGIKNGDTASELNDSWYSTDGASWTRANASCGWHIRSGSAGCVYNNRMWIMGGMSYASGLYYNDIWYSTDGANWIQACATAPWPGRWRHEVIVYNNKMWLTSGMPAGPRFNDTWYSSDGVNWTSVGNVTFGARASQVFLNHSGKMWVTGGYDNNVPVNDTWHSPDEVVLFNDNSLAADGAALTNNTNDPTHGADALRNQSYKESNPFNNSLSTINISQDGKWDFSLQAAAYAPFQTTYCFRCAKSSGNATAGMNYTVYPQITTVKIPQPNISSAANQIFGVGYPATAISTITIIDDSLSPGITAQNGIRITIPAAFNMTWNASDMSATIGGANASKVFSTASYEDANQTLVLNVLSDFNASDTITVSGLQFANFNAVSAADNLQLRIYNNATISAYDNKTIQIIWMENDAGTWSDAGNTSGTATPITNPGEYTGYIWNLTDADYYKFGVTSGTRYVVYMQPPYADDYDLALLNSTGATVGQSQYGNDQEERIEFTANETANWYLKAVSFNNTSSDQYNTYTFRLLNATYYYVRQDGTAATGRPNGDPNTPAQCSANITNAFATIKTNYTNDIRGRGEMIISVRNISAVEYPGSLLSGLFTNTTGRLTIENYTGEIPRINASATDQYGFLLGAIGQGDNNLSYTTISGLYIMSKGLTTPIFRQYQNNLTSGEAIVQDCVFDGQNLTRTTTFVYGLVYYPNAIKTTVRRNIFKNIKSNYNNNSSSGVAFFRPLVPAGDVFIKDNSFYDSDARAIQVGGNLTTAEYYNATIERNRIYNNVANSSLVYLSDNLNSNVTFRNNAIYNNNLGRINMTNPWNATCYISNITNVNVYNNVFYNNNCWKEIWVLTNCSSGINISNNIVWPTVNVRWGIVADSPATNGISCRNNTFYADFQNNGYAAGSGFNTAENTETIGRWNTTNMTTSAWNSAAVNNTGNGYTYGGPGLVSATDMHLNATSLCIDRGLNLTSSVLDDVDGVTRPQAAAPDIGASEYMATAVKFASLDAIGLIGKVDIRWRTASEYRNAGFNIYVSSAKDGAYQKVNSALISGLGNSFSGQEYSFIDTNVTNGTTYYYKLEELDLTGNKLMHGPVEAHPGKDTDADGMTNDWELYYGLNANDPADANTDLSGDGLTNLQKFTQNLNPKVNNTPTPPPAQESGGIRIVESSDTGIILELNTSEFLSQDKLINNTTYQALTIPGYAHSYTQELGKAKIPFKPVLLGIPQNSTCAVQILDQNTVEMGNYTVEPVIEYSLANNTTTSAIEAGGFTSIGAVDIASDPAKKDEAFYLQNSWYPADITEVGYLGELRGQHVASVNIYPLRFNPAKKDLSFSKSIRLKLAFTPAAVQAAASLLTNLPNTVKLKVYTQDAGLYRLTWEDLYNAGLNDLVWSDPRKIKLYNNGNEVAIRVVGEEDGVFNYGDYIEFYATENSGKYSKYNVYILAITDGNGKRMAAASASNAVATESVAKYRYTAHLENNTLYWADRTGDDNVDRWLWNDPIWNGTQKDYQVNLKHVATDDPGETANVTLAYYAFYSNTTHNTLGFANGAVIDDGVWAGNDERVITVAVPQNIFNEGNNTLSLETRIVAPADYDVIAPNYFDLEYSRQLIAENDTLVFAHTPAASTITQFTLEGFSKNTLELYEITDPENPVYISDGYNVTYTPADNTYSCSFKTDFAANTQRKFICLNPEKAKGPATIKFAAAYPELTSNETRADYVMITYGDFTDNLAPLKSLYEKQGLAVAVVDISSVYTEFANGQETPYAIKDFLKFTYENWRGPAHNASPPSYVLLVGRATFDYRDNRNNGNLNLVPTYLAPNMPPTMGEAPADNWFVCLSGNDTNGNPDVLPDMFIGRIPARTKDDVDNVVNKIITYTNTNATDWQKTVTFASDTDQIFSTVSDDLLRVIPDSLSKQTIYAKNYPQPANFTASLVNAFSSGTLLLNYVGHGANNIWTSENLFNTNTVATLTNTGKYPFVVSFDCMDGYYIIPGDQDTAMADALLRKKDAGAIACFAPTGMGFPPAHQILGEALYTSIFNNTTTTLGPATTQAKILTFTNTAGNLREFMDTYTLFGDPALTLKVPPTPTPTPSPSPSATPSPAANTTTSTPNVISQPQTFGNIFGSVLLNPVESKDWRDKTKEAAEQAKEEVKEEAAQKEKPEAEKSEEEKANEEELSRQAEELAGKTSLSGESDILSILQRMARKVVALPGKQKAGGKFKTAAQGKTPLERLEQGAAPEKEGMLTNAPQPTITDKINAKINNIFKNALKAVREFFQKLLSAFHLTRK